MKGYAIQNGETGRTEVYRTKEEAEEALRRNNRYDHKCPWYRCDW